MTGNYDKENVLRGTTVLFKGGGETRLPGKELALDSVQTEKMQSL